jgi:hypothetical protein
MKPLFFCLLTFLVFTARAQWKRDSVLSKPISNKATLPAKPAMPVKSKPEGTQPVLTDADYFLAGAVVRVSTGGDNKEPSTSTAFFQLRPRKANGMVVFRLDEYANEIKANQATDLRLDRAVTLNTAQNSLYYYKQNGLSLMIAYCNKNFCTDAWAISSITLTLEFKDASGNPAPGGFGSRTISFPVSSGTLGFVAGCNPFWVTDGKMCGHSDQQQKMLLKTDEFFNPLPGKLLKWWDEDVN